MKLLAAEDIDRLAIYNAERQRGLVHTDLCDREMARLQECYDEQIAALAALTPIGRRTAQHRKSQPQRLLEEIVS